MFKEKLFNIYFFWNVAAVKITSRPIMPFRI